MKLKPRNGIDRYLLIVFVLATIVVSFTNCDKLVRPDNSTQISTHGDDEGHERGKNCMNCHYSEGRGEGWFTLGGNIDGNPGDGMVYLYSDWNLPPVDSLEIDADGYVYTTEDIDFSNGLQVAVVSGIGVEHQMSGKIVNGQCNLCHGVTTTKISF